MKKIILFLSIFFSLSLQSIPGYIGPYLYNLRKTDLLKNSRAIQGSNLIINTQIPGQKIYQVNVLHQGNTGTCARHAIKNLIYFINAVLKPNKQKFKNALAKVYRAWPFKILNKDMCSYMGIANKQQTGTYAYQVRNTLNSMYNKSFQSFYPQSGKLLPNNIKKLLDTKTFDFIDFMDAFSPVYKYVENQSYLYNSLILKQITLSNPFDKMVKCIYEFKTSPKKVFGMILFFKRHATTLVVNKVKKTNDYEFFYLDSSHLSTYFWDKPVKFIKYLFDLPNHELRKLF